MGSLHLTAFAGFFSKSALWSLSLLVIFFSVAGVPPFAGFFAKIIIILELIARNSFLTAVLLILVSSASAFYYIRVLKILFFEKKNKKNQEDSFQIIFTNSHNQKIYFIFALFLIFLILFLFLPTGLSLLTSNVSLATIF